MRIIRKIEQSIPTVAKRKKVAAYARVSMESERMQHSLSAQVSYYSSLIQKNPEWEYAGVYADYGISGTSTQKRQEFRRMLADAEAGRIDIILTKSIHRFARNTVDLLKTVRHLKELGVEVWFEKENIHTMSGDGELMLTILASFAQEESRSISENVKWGTRKKFAQGIPNGHPPIYGYRWEGDELVIVPQEADVVRLIYDNFLKGLSAESTEKQLEAMDVKSCKGGHFSNSSIRTILQNVTYTGNLLFQKEYNPKPGATCGRKNRGELPQYWVENTHEAIIPMVTYQAVQNEIKRRKKMGVFANWSIHTTCFTGKIKCGLCGKSYRRSGKRQRKDPDKVYYTWICRTKSEKGAAFCRGKTIPEEILKKVCAEILELAEFDETVFLERVSQIVVIGDDVLEFHFTDGSQKRVQWQSTAKKDWWNEKRRREWGELHKNRGTNPNKARYNELTGFIKCGRCGANYRSHGNSYKDGTEVRHWRCCEACGNSAIKDSEMKRLIAETLGLSVYSADAMDATMEKAVVGDGIVTFYFLDGSTKQSGFINKKHGTLHTEKYKAHMSELMKQRWREKKSDAKKSNDNPGNNQ